MKVIEMSHPGMKIVQYSFITYRISSLGLSQSLIAKALGCSAVMLNLVIQGKRQSKRIQDGLALCLGLKSWKQLVDSAYAWDDVVRKIHRRQEA